MQVAPPTPMDVARFLDVEAIVNEDGEDDDFESEDDYEFVVDDHERDVGPQPHLYTWDALDSWKEDNSPELLQDLALDVQRRHRAVSNVQCTSSHIFDDPPVGPLPAAQDMIWRVRVQAGRERDVVLAILQNSLTSSLGILSAFTRDSIPGWVYIEAKHATHLAPALLAIPGVARRRGSLVVKLVELSDRPLLLNMSLQGSTPPFSAGSWVRIKDGLYKGDLGLVRDVDPCDRELFSVMLVPRLHMTKSKKRKRGDRPSKALFDRVGIESIFGEGSVKIRNQFQVFRKNFFCSGLVEKTFHPTRLSPETSHASPDELDPFRGCEYWTDAGHLLRPIRAGDRILVMTGSLQGCSGNVVEVNETTLRFKGEGGVVHEVRRAEVRKHFVRGDFVEVVEGPDQGARGFIVDSNDTAVVIYGRAITIVQASETMAVQHEQDGREIHANTADLDWMDHSSVFDPSTSIRTPASASEVLLDDIYSYATFPKDSEILARQLQNERIKMHTGDPYVHMEVRIIKGVNKGHQGAVKGSHFSAKGETLVDVLTSTHVINTQSTYSINALREKYTGLPLERARWIPFRYLWRNTCSDDPIPSSTPMNSRPSTPTTPQDAQSVPEGNVQTDSPDKSQPVLAHTLSPPVSAPGTWLLDPRLTMKRLDVRIQGTTNPAFHKGRYEGQAGFTVVTKPPPDVAASTIVKLGYSENRLAFQLRHLLPETTTERAGFVTSEAAIPITSVVKTRVVIIGPDLSGDTSWIGMYGFVTACPYPLESGQALVRDLVGRHAYFHRDSLCRSHMSDQGAPINWYGTLVY